MFAFRANGYIIPKEALIAKGYKTKKPFFVPLDQHSISITILIYGIVHQKT